MTDTAIASAQYIVPGAPSKEPAHNDALERLEQLAQITVVNRTTTSAPSSPSQGAAYIVASVPTGVWSAQTHRIAAYYSGWTFLDPREGWKAYDQNTDQGLVFDGSVWQLDRAERFPSGGFKNRLINANFDIWQRGTSITISGGSNGFTADRWWVTSNVAETIVFSRQTFTVGQTDVPGNPKYFARHDKTVGVGSNQFVQKVEGVETFAGATVTLSFYAKVSAAMSLTNIQIRQNFGTGGAPSTEVTTVVATTPAISTNWANYEYTVSLPSISGKTLGSNGDDYITVHFQPDGTAEAFDVAQVQLELGSAATIFERRSIGQELALCQRYLPAVNSEGGGPESIAQSAAISSTRTLVEYVFPVTPRVAPTGITISAAGDFRVATNAGGNISCSLLAFSNAGTRGCRLIADVASGLNAGESSSLLSNAAAARILFTGCEL